MRIKQKCDYVYYVRGMGNDSENGENGEDGYSRKKRKLSHNANLVLTILEESSLNRYQKKRIVDAIKASRGISREDRKVLYGGLAQMDQEEIEEIIEFLEDKGG